MGKIVREDEVVKIVHEKNSSGNPIKVSCQLTHSLKCTQIGNQIRAAKAMQSNRVMLL